MTPTREMIKQAYVEGFLQGLAERGVTPSQAGEALITKKASLWDLASLALVASVGTPAVVGYAGGRMMASLRGDENSEQRLRQIKQRQLTHQIRLSARRLLQTTPETAPGTVKQRGTNNESESTSLAPINAFAN